MRAIIVHGGAGKWSGERLSLGLDGVREAVEAGWQALVRADAVEAVVAAVAAMEDNPVFNAGLGSALTLLGQVEPEASVMRGDTLEAGAVSGPAVKNPVKLARLVMLETDHVILVGEGARLFAKAMGFEEVNLVVDHRERSRRKILQDIEQGREVRHWTRIQRLIKQHPEYQVGDTVGAVAVDHQGVCAAATSTGGVMLKLPGRMGDSPVPGAGNYACESGAVSATGEGEGMLRTFAAGYTCQLISQNTDVQQAVQQGVERVGRLTGKECGMIAVDRHGNLAAHRNTRYMPHAMMREDFDGPKVFE